MVETGIIAAMVIISLMLLHYILVGFYSPYRRRMNMEALKSMFASHILALADVLYDVGFIITVFVLGILREVREGLWTHNCQLLVA